MPGAVFGLGWTPYLGPALTAGDTLASSAASALRGAIRGLAHCVGLGVPFVLMARCARRPPPAGRPGASCALGGAPLVLLGLLLLTGWWDGLMIWLRAWLAATGLGTSVT